MPLRQLFALPLIFCSTGVWAQATTAVSERSTLVTARVPILCQIGTGSSPSGSFPLGVLIDTSTGKLRRDLSAPDLTFTDTWCNAASQIEISAVPLAPSTNRRVPRTGFTRTIHFTATALGWGDMPVVYQTDGGEHQTGAMRTITTPKVATIEVAVSKFRPQDGDEMRPIADINYVGTVLLTLRPTP